MWPTPAPDVPRWADPIVIVGEAVTPQGAASFAPNIPAGTWPTSALPVPFVLALPRSRDVGAEAGAELDVALRAWPGAACTGWRARYDGERAAVAADDGVNVVLFHDDAWPADLVPGAVAQTVIHTDGSGRYRDADIHVNGKDFRFSLDAAAGTLDLRSVLVHELGHAIGLGHSDDARATMFATGSGLRWRSLEKDDLAGVCALYPGTGTAGCDAAAGTPCPAPFVCVAGACQRPSEKRDVCSPCERVTGACEGAGDDARCIDVGEGTAAGRVCGRGCATDGECGTGFRCLATTAAGDRQCLSDVACRNGASPCATDAQCKEGSCRAGACLGPGEVADAGADAGVGDAGTDSGVDAGGPLDPGGGGCGCRVITSGAGGEAGRAGGLGLLLGGLGAALLGLALRRRRRG